MTGFAILAMAGGLAMLGWLPPSKDKRLANLGQLAGGLLFGGGLVGLVFELFPHTA